MSRWLALAALGAAFLAIPAWAQHHGGGFAAGGGHFGGGFHGSMGGGMRGPAISGRSFGGFPHGGVRVGPGFRGPGFVPRPFFRHRFYPYYAYGYPGWLGYGDYGYDQPYYPYDDYADDYYPRYDQSQDAQQAEIDRLNDEVARLREEREARDANASSKNVRVRTEADTTELVFRDRHTEEIENYAIVGQTLWIFTDQQAKKVTLAELDVPATQKANADRGVDFRIPR
jgi:hypothetical protein